MSAASARAIASHRNAATHEGLERAVAWSRQWSAEFPFCLANHLPMVLVALHRMGASDERLEAYCQIYHRQNGLVPVPEPMGAITRDNWREFLGHREREADYRTFFASEVARLGATPAARHYLPQLMPGIAASATHAFMRMAYATMTDSDEETGVALAYWAATYLSLGPSQGLAPSTDDPAEVLAFMYGPASFRQSSPSAISCGTSCARCRRSQNSPPSSIGWRSGQRPMTGSLAARWRSTPRHSTSAPCTR